MPGRSSLKFETASESGLRTVKKLVPMELYLAAGITDGEGKKENRLLIRAQGAKQFYFLFPKGTEAAMKPAAGWLQELLEQETGDGTPSEIPDDPVTDVPTGDPLED